MSDSKALEYGVKFTELVGAAMSKTAQFIADIRKDAEAESPKIKQAVKSLKAAGLIDDDQVKQAMSRLSSNAGSLDVLMNVVDAFQRQEEKHAKDLQKKANTDLGSPDGAERSSDAREKRASAVTGYRRGDDDNVDEATLAMMKRLGLPFGG